MVLQLSTRAPYFGISTQCTFKTQLKKTARVRSGLEQLIYISIERRWTRRDSETTSNSAHDAALVMENLTISDPPPPPMPHGGPGGMPPVLGRPPPPPQQLPAQMFTTAAQLLDLTDSKHASDTTWAQV